MAKEKAASRLIAILAWSMILAPAKTIAQDAPAENGDVPPGEAPSAAPLEPIIVTARRRDEPLQRTPVSVVALSAKDLEDRSLTNLRDLQTLVPNLTLAASQNVGEAAGNAFIRGIGQEDFIAGAEPGVGFYVDGVYIATTRGTLMNLTDIARVEVLRGPQGTLFGRNTVGGAINIISVRPQPERLGRLNVVLGSFDRAELRALLNEPLTDTLFARAWGTVVTRDGYLKRLAPPQPIGPRFAVNNEREGSDRSQAGRLQLRWLISDNVTADLSLDGSRARTTQGAIRIDALDPAFGIFPILNDLIVDGRLPGPVITADLPPEEFLASYAGGRNFSKRDNVGLSSNFTGELGATTARLILAWRNLRTWIGTDSDGLYFDLTGSEFRDEHDQYSGELDVTGTRGQLTYTAGVFALVERAESFPTRSPLQNSVLLTCRCFFPPGGGPQPLTVHRLLKGESYAIFGQASYKLTDRLSGTLGARYSNEKKSIRAESILVDRVTLLPTETVFATGRNRDSWGALTWRAGLEFQATRDIMVYGAAAKGYKSGGFNVRPVTNLPNLGLASFGPETAILYEMGARSEWLDRRLRLNLTLFHTSYRDIQLRRQTEIDGILTTLIENAARARIRGVEVELLARPLERLTLSLAYGHLAPQYLDPGGVPGITTESRFQRTPGHSLAGSVHFEQPVRGGTIELHGDVGYRSKEQFQLLPRPHDPDGYGLLRARATFRPAGGGWSLAVFGTNLTNKEYRTAGRGTVEEGGIAFSSVGMPRTFGVQAQFDY